VTTPRRLLIAGLALASLAVPLAHAETTATPTATSPTPTPPTTAGSGDANPGQTPVADVEVAPDEDLLPADVDLNLTGTCDDLDPAACLLPFPNDRFTVPDPSTDTGRRVAFDPLSMPRNVAGVAVDPTEWNRNDGFSPSTPVLTYVPGLDLAATWHSRVPHIADLARFSNPDAPIVLLDATTGRRTPFWSELDQHPGTTDADRVLLLRPASQLIEGHRYIVALRRLRRADGSLIGASPLFQTYRDRTPAPFDAPVDTEARRPHLERLFAELGRAGVDRKDLFLTWDFTIASRRNLTERVLRLRDQTFAGLGDTNLADRTIAGRPPAFTVTKVQDFPTGATMRRVEGTISVPNYMTPQAEVSLQLPDPIGNVGQALKDVLGQAGLSAALKPVTSALPIDPLDVLSKNLSVPLSRFSTIGSTDGLPTVDPVQPTVDVPFDCEIARTSLKAASHPALYGHGLLGSRTEVTGGSTDRLRERGVTPCAIDWWGFSFADLPNVAVTLLDLSNFASVIDRSQQGFLNFLVLGRALSHPKGFATDPAFQDAKGRPLIRTGELVYDGNSQGAIMGGALTALAPDLQRSVLGVAGMGYSTLLNRSVDWEDKYAAIFEAAYPKPIDQQLGYGLMQMLWDRGESAGYAQQMTSHPLPNTPTHDVMLQIAFGDHQVANVAAEVEGRTIGAAMWTPALAAGRHWSTDPAFGFRTVSTTTPDVGSVLVYWFSEGLGNATPPNANVPDHAGKDPHESPRRYGPATDQVLHFLLTGELVDVCHGPCTIPAPPK
jgi:hypothetical protein